MNRLVYSITDSNLLLPAPQIYKSLVNKLQIGSVVKVVMIRSFMITITVYYYNSDIVLCATFIISFVVAFLYFLFLVCGPIVTAEVLYMPLMFLDTDLMG